MWNPIKAYERWCQKQYDVWGSKLQKKYNFWSDYDDPEFRAKCKALWEKLPLGIQKSIHKMLIDALKRYGPEFAKQLLVSISTVFMNAGSAFIL